MTGPASPSDIRRVAVIGAGPIGISAAKCLVGEQHFDTIDVFEQQSSFGGAWLWTQPQKDDVLPVPQTRPLGPLDQVHTVSDPTTNIKPPFVMTPMYDQLETNIPHTLMTFSDKGFPEHVPLFPPRQSVLEYIGEYGADVKSLVHFNTQVTRLDLLQGHEPQDLWSLTVKNLTSGQASTREYDAVALANGHFALPSLPDVKGMSAWQQAYPGSIMHAKWYRNAAQFTGLKAVVVGNASSGIDIGSQISMVCKKPIVISARSEPQFKLPDWAEHKALPNIVEFIDPRDGNRAIKFGDGSVEHDVDVVLYCTGYFFNFPFLSDTIQNQITSTGYMVQGTYQHLFWRPHSTLAFMGLPNKILPMPLGEAQGAVVARVWSGRLELPSHTEMNLWELERWRTQADQLKSRGKEVSTATLEKVFHTMGYPHDLDYHNHLVTWAGEATGHSGRHLPHFWDEREYWLRSEMAAVKKAFANLREGRQNIKTLEQLGFDYEKHRAEKEAQS